MFLAVAVSLDLETVGTLLLGVILSVVAYSDWKIKRARPETTCRECMAPLLAEIKTLIEEQRHTVETWSALDAERARQLNRTLERIELVLDGLRRHRGGHEDG